MISRRGETQLDCAAVETFVKGPGIQIAGTFIEQVCDEMADAGFVGRILGRTAAERVLHRNQRHRGVLHEPRLDASG